MDSPRSELVSDRAADDLTALQLTAGSGEADGIVVVHL